MKKKIAIVHPRFGRGGSEARPLWLVSALKHEYDVTLITSGPFDLEVLNAFYGTHLILEDFTLIAVKIPRLFEKRFDALRHYKLARYAKKRASQFDIMVSTYNVMDFGKQGIQFIADLSFSDELRRKYDPAPGQKNQWLYKKSLVRKWYLAFAGWLSSSSKDGWKKNVTVANSVWTKNVLKDFYGVEAEVIYPAVVFGGKNIPWQEKKHGFVCLGRISPEKELEKVIGMVQEVRKEYPEVTLHIIGKVDDSDYSQLIKRLCAENKEWCFLEGEKSGQEKADFLSNFKYGVSGRSNEPFGIAAAEMIKSGCIVFVPNGGGQTEIVGDSRLIYESKEDGIRNMKAVLENASLQLELSEYLKERSSLFSADIFMKNASQLIKHF